MRDSKDRKIIDKWFWAFARSIVPKERWNLFVLQSVFGYEKMSELYPEYVEQIYGELLLCPEVLEIVDKLEVQE